MKFTAEGQRFGRPRYPATPLEQLFLGAGITRELLANETRYNQFYVASVLRGTERLSARFVGRVILRWPELAGDLAQFVKGEGGDGDIQAGT